MPRIRETGAELVAISPQLPEQSREFRGERSLAFDVLSDPGNATADLYGLAWTLPAEQRVLFQSWGIDLPLYNGDDTWRVPMPARYVVDRERQILYARVDPNYMMRPEPAETLEFLRGLGA